MTQWDIIEGNCRFWRGISPLLSLELGDFFSITYSLCADTDTLSYCGEIAESFTQGPSKTVYNTECNIIPEFVGELEDHTKMYKPEIDLTLTCYTNDGDVVLGNGYVIHKISNRERMY